MPQNVGTSTLDLDEKSKNVCKHIPLNSPWTTTSQDESPTVIIPCLK